MSGICGVVDFEASRLDPEGLRSMVELSSYRAPGGAGYLFLNEAGLAHQALRAPSAGAGLDQPLLEPRHQVCVVMDGRLDNRSDLIGRLSPAEGNAISDAGLLLAAYLEWGTACSDHLLGDFAFAVWDAPRRRLFCAIDPLGIKPLHYACVGSLVCFASDAVQVLGHPAVPDDYNEREIAAYLASQAEDPEQSFFAAVHKLAPGHRLIAESGTLSVERYWSPGTGEIRYARDEDYAAHFRELLQKAVTDRLRGAGTFAGVAMSGGLDSTSVAALAQRASGSGIRAYSFVFDRFPECDERAYSQAMSDELGLAVEPVEAELLLSLESQNALPHSPDTPFVGWRTCYQEVFRRMTANGSRVLLMGHGGDDLLRGSSLVYAERLRRGELGVIREVVRHTRGCRESISRSLYRHFGRPHLPAGVDRLLTSTQSRQGALLPSLIQPDFVRRIKLDELRADLEPRRRIFASQSRQEVYANLVETPWYWRLANWHDRNAASLGIEVRHPFLDTRLFEYVLAIPGEQLFRLGFTKNLLRRAMAGVLPERIRLRESKTRFTRFLDFVLLERASGEIHDLLKAPRSADLGFLSGERLRSAYIGLARERTDEARRALWYAINLEIWLRRCEALRDDRRRNVWAKRAVA
jgi:asparagine synthase (glutamine-hydrolysing)